MINSEILKVEFGKKPGYLLPLFLLNIVLEHLARTLKSV